jgi:hypothetical protein
VVWAVEDAGEVKGNGKRKRGEEVGLEIKVLDSRFCGRRRGCAGSWICRPKTLRLAIRTMLVGCELCLYVI